MTATGTPRALDTRELQAWLRLARSENIGPVTFRQLIARFGDAATAIEHVPELARRGGRSLTLADPEAIVREMEAIDGLGGYFVASVEPDYPAALGAVDAAPPVLSVIGGRTALATPSVAIVGSRNASAAGRKFAATLAAGIGAAGYAIVSGLARGVDTAAHEGACATGTVAVLAGGFAHIYPPENVPLAERIVQEGGALVTEMPFDLKARGKDFPRRNRIISGLSLATIVIEAARKSGSLITARRAADQGRPVFAVPGSPLDPRAEGTNLLIREGATLVTTVEDVLADLAPMAAREPVPASGLDHPQDESVPAAGDLDADDSARGTVVEALGPSPVAVDDIARVTGLRLPVIHLVLMELTLAGRLQRHGGQRVSLIS